MKSQHRKIRYGVIGLGHLAQTAVLPAFAQAHSNSTLCALITGDPSKAKKLAAQYQVKGVYGYEDFDKLLDDDLIDALYIALPNHLHFKYALRALEAGLHVLCEKPLTTSVKKAELLKKFSEKNDCKMMTAYRLHFEPANLKVIDICRSGDLGELKYFSSDFSFQVKDPQNIRLRKETVGGTLWDIGIYCINAVRNIYEAEPIEVFAFAGQGKDARFREVEESVSAVLKFPNDRLATFTCSFGASPASRFQVYGSKGGLTLENAYEIKNPRQLLTTMNGKERHTEFKSVDQFAPQLTYFSNCILKNELVEPSVEEGLADVRVIKALYKSIEKGKPVQMKPETLKKERPTMKMRASYPAIEEPRVFNAKAAH